MVLEEYKELVGDIAGIATIGQMFSGVFTCKDIIQEGSTKNVPVAPFLGGAAISVLMFKYAEILQDPAMIKVNIAGLSLSVAYMIVYYIYCREKGELLSQVFKASAAVGLLWAYSVWEDQTKIEFRFGIIMTALFFMLIGSPFLSLGEVIRTKSTAMLPLPMILSGTVVGSLWLLYGIIIKNTFIQVQNVVGLGMSVVQLALFAIYPRRPVDAKKE